MKKYLGPSKFLAVLVFIPVFIGCKDKITPPVIDGDYSLCYEASYNGHSEIFTNNITGTARKDISNYSGDDEYPQWSPDGRYIVYSRSSGVVVYDTKTQANTVLTTDSVDAGLMPQWTPNGKIFFYCRSSYDVHDPGATYIMNPDGSRKKKILDSEASIYFYHDSYTFLYIIGTKVYKTNIDNTFNEFVLELPSPGSDQFVTIRDFNPLTGDFLVSTNTIPGSSDAIATYNVETKQFNQLVTAEEGYVLYLQKYSNDFSKIAFVEGSSNDEYLSVLENGVKRRLVRIPATTPPVHFSFEPMQFSPDGKYNAFSKQVFQSGQWVSWTEYLYAVDVATGNVQYIDEGFYPSWNPRP